MSCILGSKTRSVSEKATTGNPSYEGLEEKGYSCLSKGILKGAPYSLGNYTNYLIGLKPLPQVPFSVTFSVYVPVPNNTHSI